MFGVASSNTSWIYPPSPSTTVPGTSTCATFIRLSGSIQYMGVESDPEMTATTRPRSHAVALTRRNSPGNLRRGHSQGQRSEALPAVPSPGTHSERRRGGSGRADSSCGWRNVAARRHLSVNEPNDSWHQVENASPSPAVGQRHANPCCYRNNTCVELPEGILPVASRGHPAEFPRHLVRKRLLSHKPAWPDVAALERSTTTRRTGPLPGAHPVG